MATKKKETQDEYEARVAEDARLAIEAAQADDDVVRQVDVPDDEVEDYLVSCEDVQSALSNALENVAAPGPSASDRVCRGLAAAIVRLGLAEQAAGQLREERSKDTARNALAYLKDAVKRASLVRVASESPRPRPRTKRERNPGLRYFLLTFVQLPDGRIGFATDDDLPGDRQLVMLESGVQQVFADRRGWEEDVEEGDAAGPDLDDFAQALFLEHERRRVEAGERL